MKEAIKDYLEYLSEPDTQIGLFLTNIIAALVTLLIVSQI